MAKDSLVVDPCAVGTVPVIEHILTAFARDGTVIPGNHRLVGEYQVVVGVTPDCQPLRRYCKALGGKRTFGCEKQRRRGWHALEPGRRRVRQSRGATDLADCGPMPKPASTLWARGPAPSQGGGDDSRQEGYHDCRCNREVDAFRHALPVLSNRCSAVHRVLDLHPDPCWSLWLGGHQSSDMLSLESGLFQEFPVLGFLHCGSGCQGRQDLLRPSQGNASTRIVACGSIPRKTGIAERSLYFLVPRPCSAGPG